MELGSNFIIHCTVQGKSITYIHWVNSGKRKSHSHHNYIVCFLSETQLNLHKGVSKPSNGATLFFTSVSQSNESTYTCNANSTGGGFGGDSIFVDVIRM